MTARVAHLSEIERLGGWIQVRRHFDVRAFGVNAFTGAAPGDEVIEEHHELGSGAGRHEELYFVASGRARFRLDEEELEAGAGTFVFVPDPAVRRHAVALEPDTTVLVVGGRADEPFQVSIWERAAEARPFAEAGDYGRAIEVQAALLAEHPGNGGVLYNLACYESLAGRPAEALEHLRQALEAEPRAREWLASDTDLDPIRGEAGFPSV